MTNFSIIIDSREKKYKHIQERLDMLGVKYEKRNLNYGDYSFNYNGESYENKFVIERKGSINEIVGNLTKGKKRFENEFKRAKGSKMIVMIEAEKNDINSHNYKSTMTPGEVKNRLSTWSNHFQLTIVYVKKELAGDFILDSFKNYIEKLEEK